ncbi:hypothetical protein BC829DRAFT_442190 [Chytridium lagenaria]|nr:hypothetical protein BC829DRAFT_442190 [Chytridium lagenaria]
MVSVLLEEGLEGVEKKNSLKTYACSSNKKHSEVLNRFENSSFACEYNMTESEHSRNLENLSEKYPDILSNIPKILREGTRSFVLDCEAVAWDREKKCILPFQILSTRKRKGVAEEDITVHVCLFAFDLLFLNGESVEANAVDEIQTFLDESIAGNCEGLMVKALDQDSSYEPSVTFPKLAQGMQVKKDYLDGVGDSLDLVVIGGYSGRGKRTGWYGSYLLACYDEDSEVYQSICKVSTGLSEDDLTKNSEFFAEHVLASPPSYYKWSDTPQIRPDVWEIKAADLSISPVHFAGAGLVDPNKGISLRFPRFIRIRDDKTPEQATSADQVAAMYRSQKLNTATEVNDDDDWEETHILEGLFNIRKRKKEAGEEEEEGSEEEEDQEEKKPETIFGKTFKVPERLERSQRGTYTRLEEGVLSKEDIDIEAVKDGESHVEMNLGLGVLDVELNVDEAVKRKNPTIRYKNMDLEDDIEITELRTNAEIGKKPPAGFLTLRAKASTGTCGGKVLAIASVTMTAASHGNV